VQLKPLVFPSNSLISMNFFNFFLTNNRNRHVFKRKSKKAAESMIEHLELVKDKLKYVIFVSYSVNEPKTLIVNDPALPGGS